MFYLERGEAGNLFLFIYLLIYGTSFFKVTTDSPEFVKHICS